VQKLEDVKALQALTLLLLSSPQALIAATHVAVGIYTKSAAGGSGDGSKK
jgi:hypothetical protein